MIRRLSVTFLFVVGVCGCSAHPKGAPAPHLALPELESLLETHGGAAAWCKHEAVRFRYRLRTRGQEAFFELPAVAFRLRDYRYVWILSGNGDTWERVSLLPEDDRPHTQLASAVGATGKEWDGDLDALDFALCSLRHLFQPILATTTGSWAVRTLIAPPGVETTRPIELVPRTPTSPHLVCLIFRDDESGLLASTLSASVHPWFGEETLRTSFSEYETVDGVRIATRRLHEVHGRRETPAPDPFPEVPGPPPPPPLLEERISAVQFLDEAFAREHLVVPEEEGEESTPSDDSGKTPAPAD